MYYSNIDRNAVPTGILTKFVTVIIPAIYYSPILKKFRQG